LTRSGGYSKEALESCLTRRTKHMSVSFCCKCRVPIWKDDVYAKMVIDFFSRGAQEGDRWVSAENRVEYPLCSACAALLHQVVLQAIDSQQQESKPDT